MALMTLHFSSRYLRGRTDISVILPDNINNLTPGEFYGRDKKYPVLWLLHGGGGDHSEWVRMTNVELYACERELIVVMPSALNSDYFNWRKPRMQYEMFDYLTEELMPLIYNWLPASSRREDNFIAGLSMGGIGSLKYAAAHPDKFAACAVMSSTINDPRGELDGTIPTNPLFVAAMMQRAAEFDSLDDYLDSYDNIWGTLEKSAKAYPGKMPRIYYSVGSEDHPRPEVVLPNLKKYTEELGIEAKFEVIPGYKHEWRCWEIAIQKALSFFFDE